MGRCGGGREGEEGQGVVKVLQLQITDPLFIVLYNILSICWWIVM